MSAAWSSVAARSYSWNEGVDIKIVQPLLQMHFAQFTRGKPLVLERSHPGKDVPRPHLPLFAQIDEEHSWWMRCTLLNTPPSKPPAQSATVQLDLAVAFGLYPLRDLVPLQSGLKPARKDVLVQLMPTAAGSVAV